MTKKWPVSSKISTGSEAALSDQFVGAVDNGRSGFTTHAVRLVLTNDDVTSILCGGEWKEKR